jgi:hypothetical protein
MSQGKVTADFHTPVTLMRVLGDFAFVVHPINDDVNMWMLTVIVPKSDELIVIIAHVIEETFYGMVKEIIGQFVGVMLREGQDDMADWFGTSNAHLRLHDEAIGYRPIV